jgi:hypothetical protein
MIVLGFVVMAVVASTGGFVVGAGWMAHRMANKMREGGWLDGR